MLLGKNWKKINNTGVILNFAVCHGKAEAPPGTWPVHEIAGWSIFNNRGATIIMYQGKGLALLAVIDSLDSFHANVLEGFVRANGSSLPQKGRFHVPADVNCLATRFGITSFDYDVCCKQSEWIITAVCTILFYTNPLCSWFVRAVPWHILVFFSCLILNNLFTYTWYLDVYHLKVFLFLFFSNESHCNKYCYYYYY